MSLIYGAFTRINRILRPSPTFRRAKAVAEYVRAERLACSGTLRSPRKQCWSRLRLCFMERKMRSIDHRSLYSFFQIMVTTNLPFDEWIEVFGSERLTGALLDRLTHHVHILEMNGESYRLKRSRENAAAQAPDESDNP